MQGTESYKSYKITDQHGWGSILLSCEKADLMLLSALTLSLHTNLLPSQLGIREPWLMATPTQVLSRSVAREQWHVRASEGQNRRGNA